MSNFPERWDRSRFERFGGGGPPPTRYEEDYRYRETDRPGRRDVMVADRVDERGPGGTYEERDRYFEEDRYRQRQRPRRSDRELFGDVDPREFANMALTPYEPPRAQRPGPIRRQSSLDTFDRRPIPVYEREERRIPVYRPEPVYYEEPRGRGYYEPQSYREVEITREKSVGPYPKPPKSHKSSKSSKSKSKAPSSSSSSSSATEKQSQHQSHHSSHRGSKSGAGQSVHESFHESAHWPGGGESVSESFDESQHGGHESEHFHEHESFHQGNTRVSESINETVKEFKKGKTRMPKRLVRREAIQDLGYPYEEEEFFFVLKIALDKEQIDEVIKISETYWNGEKKTTFKFDETTNNNVPQINEPQEHEEVIRTEWINPPSTYGGSHRRSHSHAGNRYRRTSRANEDYYQERDKTKELVIDRSPAPPRAPVYEYERKTVDKEEDLYRTTSRGGGALVVRRDPAGEHRSTREIQDEIARLQAEGRAVRLERDAETRRDLVVRDRREEDYEVDWYGRPAREVVEFVDREPKIVTKVEKDRKGRMALVRSRD